MNDVVLKYLKEQGYNNISTDYYNYINTWDSWWRNEVDEFQKYHDQTGTERKMYTLGMAKRVSEDWSSIIYSERDEIVSEAKTKKQTEKNNEYLKKKFEDLGVYDDLPETFEKAMASGTEVAVIRVKHATIDKDKKLKVTERTKLDVIYVAANQIIPLKVEHGKIVDIAIVSEDIVDGKKEYYIEIHKLIYNKNLKKDVYYIYDTYLDDKGNKINKKDIAESYTLNSSIPLFSVMKPAIANPINENYNIVNGMGFSVFGNAEDQLKACDITYHNFVMDFYLGGKKVFYNKKIAKTKIKQLKDNKGNVKEEEIQVYPDDIMKQQWMTYGDEQMNLKEEPAVTEYNPKLRVEEDTAGINFALNMLSFKCGLGKGYYRFDRETGSIVTATQYHGDKQDLIKNANKHRKRADKFVQGIGKAILLLGRVLFKESVTEDCKISIIDKDGFMTDTETAKQEFRQDIAQGIRKAWEYRVKFLSEAEETAKAILADEDIENIDLEDDNKNVSNKRQKLQKSDKKE